MAEAKGRGSRARSSLFLSRDFGILVMALAVVSLGFGLLAPIVPQLAARLGMSEGEMGGVFALFSVAFVLALPPAGYLTDRVGRKTMLVSGIMVFASTTLLMAFITDALQFAVLRTLEGVGAAMTAPSAFALVVDLVPADKRATAMGIEGTAQTLGIFGGPAIGGFVAGEINFYYPFYVGAALAFACSAVVMLVREPEVKGSQEHPSLLTMFGAWKRNAEQNRKLSALTVRGLVMGIVQGLWNLGLLLYMYDRIGMTETEVGIALSLGTGAMAAGTLYFGKMADKHGRLPFLLGGGALMAAGLGMVVFATDVVHIYILMVVMDLGGAMSNPSVGALLADVMMKEERGRVMGAYQTVQGIGNIIGFSALGFAYEAISPEAPIVMCTLALAVATGIIAVFVREGPPAKEVAAGRRPAGAPASPERDP
jgi:MFS family permease